MKKSQLFDMTKVFGRQFMNYHVDADFNVYSTKRGGDPYKLARTGTGACAGAYYSLSTGHWGSTNYKISYIKEQLLANKEFVQYRDQARGLGATEASSIRSVTGFIVGSTFDDGSMSFSQMPKVHSTAQSAKAECERLAKAYPGKSYTYFEIKGTAKFGGVQWM